MTQQPDDMKERREGAGGMSQERSDQGSDWKQGDQGSTGGQASNWGQGNQGNQGTGQGNQGTGQGSQGTGQGSQGTDWSQGNKPNPADRGTGGTDEDQMPNR